MYNEVHMVLRVWYYLERKNKSWSRCSLLNCCFFRI